MLEDWEKFGGGVQGDSYYSKTDPNLILKLYSIHIGKEYVEREFRFNRSLSDNGIKCPEAIRMEQFGDQYGIIFKRVPNKRSFCRAAGEQPENTEKLALRLSNMIKELHARSAEGLPYPSAYTMYRNFLDKNTIIDAPMRARMEKALEEIEAEDMNTLLHGDFHYGNAITDGNEDYFIDLGNLSYGNPKFDIAMFFFVTHYGSDEVLEHNFHLKSDVAMRFWQAFKVYYYGKDIPDTELLDDFKKYMLVRTLWMQNDTGDAPYVKLFMDLFSRDDCPLETRDF